MGLFDLCDSQCVENLLHETCRKVNYVWVARNITILVRKRLRGFAVLLFVRMHLLARDGEVQAVKCTPHPPETVSPLLHLFFHQDANGNG